METRSAEALARIISKSITAWAFAAAAAAASPASSNIFATCCWNRCRVSTDFGSFFK